MTEGLQSAELNARRRFAAFISYAHADSAIAAKLQARLERYRLPKHLALAHTGGQAALGQIFRDREDLAAAPSLSDAIRAAIAEAEALIVICSPDAKASRWVGEEIALFRSLHPDRPILAAVVRGTPAESFPAALTEGGNEPLAADLRKEADGPSLGFLKIVAGIAGVPLDALVQRDAQRRIRRVMWITGGALAAMLIMGIMTTLALQARNEAARQRAEAEGLVEYMLTDLREKLKGVGKLDIMDGVNSRTLRFYSNQGSLADLPPDSLERRARILHAMGEDHELEGNVDLALQQFREAHRVTAALLSREPHNKNRIFAHAQSEYWVGEALLRQNKLDAVAPHFHAYERLADRLVEIDPGNPKWLSEAGYANGNLCTLRLAQNDNVGGSITVCQKALDRMRAVLAIDPNHRQSRLDVANRLAWLADAQKANNRVHEALKNRLEQETIIREILMTAPNDMYVKEIWLKTEIMTAEAFALNNLKTEAAQRIFVSEKVFSELKNHDSTNFQWASWSDEILDVKKLLM